MMITNFLKLIDDMYPQEVEDMKADIVDQGDSYCIEVSLPNFSKDEINVEFTPDKWLIVSAKKRETEKDKKYVKREILQQVEREWYIGEDYLPEDFSSKFESGMLLISVAKKHEPELEEKAAQIEVK